MATRMQQRRGTAAQWISTNDGDGPILEIGEIGFETDTGKFKIGDGINRWIDLDYFLDESEIDSITGDYVLSSTVGQANGIATLDGSGKLTSSQIPTSIATTTYVDDAVSNLIDSAPGALDTLNELAAAINDDASFASTITTSLGNKQDIVSGVSDTEIGYLDGVTSAIQTQLDDKLSSTNPGLIAVNSSSNALEIRQTGAGNALVVEDDTNPDATPFKILSDGKVFIGSGVVSGASVTIDVPTETTTPLELRIDQTASPTSSWDAISINANAQATGQPAYLLWQWDSITNNISPAIAGVKDSSTAAHLRLYTTSADTRFERMRIASDGATTVNYTTTTGGAVRNIYMSTSTPSGGSDGDVWIQYA